MTDEYASIRVPPELHRKLRLLTARLCLLVPGGGPRAVTMIEALDLALDRAIAEAKAGRIVLAQTEDQPI